MSLISDIGMIFMNIPDALLEAQRIQNDFRAFEDAVKFGLYQRDFALRGVIITGMEQPPRIISWQTADTWAALEALNTIAGTSFTREQYLRNPDIVFREFSALESKSAFLNEFNANRSRRNDALYELAMHQAESRPTETIQPQPQNLPPYNPSQDTPLPPEAMRDMIV